MCLRGEGFTEMLDLLITRGLPEKTLQAAQKSFHVTLRAATQPMDNAACVEALQTYDLILPTLGDAFQASVFRAVETPRCKLLANFGVGYNHIDVQAARQKGIAVTNTPGAVTEATADIALTLILMTARRAGEGERLLRAGHWKGWHPIQLLGMHLGGKTLGVIGMGRIGQAIAHRCQAALNMSVVYFNRSEKALAFPAERMPDIPSLCAAADVIVVAVPGGFDTYHLIGQSAFAAMRPHAIFINIARGDIVDEATMIAALQTGQIAGAGLDVYEQEPKVPKALCDMENVCLLPHLGTAALEVREAMGAIALENLLAFKEGRPLPNHVEGSSPISSRK